jgi:hypothetical protein
MRCVLHGVQIESRLERVESRTNPGTHATSSIHPER